MAPPAKTDALFEWVEQQELEHQQKRGAKPWGRVLDSGTGRHSLSWLLSVAERQKISDAPLHTIVAVTGEQTLADSLTESYAVEAEKTQTSVRVVAGNWVDHSFLQEESEPFDVIIAGTTTACCTHQRIGCLSVCEWLLDYLIGSIDGFAPFFQVRQRCARLGRLQLTHLYRSRTRSATASFVYWRLKAASTSWDCSRSRNHLQRSKSPMSQHSRSSRRWRACGMRAFCWAAVAATVSSP